MSMAVKLSTSHAVLCSNSLPSVDVLTLTSYKCRVSCTHRRGTFWQAIIRPHSALWSQWWTTRQMFSSAAQKLSRCFDANTTPHKLQMHTWNLFKRDRLFLCPLPVFPKGWSRSAGFKATFSGDHSWYLKIAYPRNVKLLFHDFVTI